MTKRAAQKRKRKSAFDRLMDDMTMLYASLVLTDPRINAKQIKFMYRAIGKARVLARHRRRGVTKEKA